MLEGFIFFIVATGIVLYIQYQKIPPSTPEYKPPHQKPIQGKGDE